MDLHLHILANQHAGGGSGKANLKAIGDYLTTCGVKYSVYLSEHSGHPYALTKELLKSTLIPWDEKKTDTPFPLLVGLGGDGTLHEIINGLGEAVDIPMAYIPSGSGNDFARATHISRNPLDAIKQIISIKEPKEIYTLYCQDISTNSTYYITNNLGIGLDAHIVETANLSQEKKAFNKLNIGSFIYLFSMLGVLFTQKGFQLTVKSPTKTTTFERAFLVTCSNHPYFGGGVKILPEASVYKPHVELIVVEKVSYLKIFLLLIKLAKGTHLSDKNVHHFNQNSLELIVPSQQFVQMNGEILHPSSFHVQVSSVKRLFWF